LAAKADARNLDRIRKQLSPARRRKIAARAATLIAEEKSLQELRQAHKLTQKRMAQVIGIGQDSVSRLEQRSDLLISTLRGYVEAMGGRLSLVAEGRPCTAPIRPATPAPAWQPHPRPAVAGAGLRMPTRG
jgi:DNA-binding XRE family transcriptional regulator